MNNQFTNVISYRILAQPVILPGQDAQIGSIALTVARMDAPVKRWAVTFDFLCEHLSSILGKATTAELIECLRVGQIMTLPGTYTVYQLVQLGFRKTAVNSQRATSKSGTRSSGRA
jgi:hypothetical protein